MKMEIWNGIYYKYNSEWDYIWFVKKGIELSYQRVFGNFWGNKMISHNTLYKEFLDEINQKKTIAEKEETIDELLNSEPMVSVFENELYNTDFAKRLVILLRLLIKKKHIIGK